jgi:hypothetical protein
LRKRYQERLIELKAAPGIKEHHEGLLRLLVRVELLVDVGFFYLFQRGVVDSNGGGFEKLAHSLPTWVAQLHRLYQTAGITPLVNRRVVERGESIADLLSAVDPAEEVEVDSEATN